MVKIGRGNWGGESCKHVRASFSMQPDGFIRKQKKTSIFIYKNICGKKGVHRKRDLQTYKVCQPYYNLQVIKMNQTVYFDFALASSSAISQAKKKNLDKLGSIDAGCCVAFSSQISCNNLSPDFTHWLHNAHFFVTTNTSNAGFILNDWDLD